MHWELMALIFKVSFACGAPYFFPTMKKVSKKISASHKKAKIYNWTQLV